MKTILFKNTKISYTDQGKGNAVVLLHGFLENSTMWNYLAPVLAKKNRVICVDLLGHGQSDCLGYIHSMEDMADAVHQVISELKIRKAVFVGHSMGGYVALAIAELYPELMKGLVLLNSTSRADSDERIANRTRAAVRMSIANLFSEENRTKLSEQIEWVREEALQTSLQGIIAAQEGMKLRKDQEVILHFATYPILLILGKKDPVLNYEENLEQTEGTNVKLISFNDGHMSHLENQAELEKVMVGFLKS
jgi:pimeloyl-ACP methyl ester carboxylesterase